MAKWAIVTVVLYIVLIAVLFMPAALWLVDKACGESTSLADVFTVHMQWQAWLAAAIILLAQLLMLVFPVRQYSDNPVPQRAIWVPLLTTGILLLVLLLGLTGSVMAAIWGDDANETTYYVWVPVLVAGSWVIWAIVFYCFGRASDVPAFAQRLTKWLVRGSIAELLVAVPCHIIVRHRDDCCAPGLTFIGMAAGIVVMAVAFGPSVLLLVDARLKGAYSRRTKNFTDSAGK
jgi:hypothetical protein